ncbi:MAG TPA: Spy/CpxP family protein refolding chaperone [Gemmatimonadaceae bacterium]|nr:Spy/CpxP family protein refolding chaperone [Gemmatimonadaceae bacterium]
MRKTMMTVGLALAIGAGVAGAQSSTPGATRDTDGRPRRERVAQDGGERGQRGGRRGGPGGALLKGITLTDAQKAQLKAQREKSEPQAKALREQFGTIMRDERAARERGDSAGVKAARERAQTLRTQMEPLRQQQIASLRAVLTPEQQKQLDANLAQIKERGEKRGEGRRGK